MNNLTKSPWLDHSTAEVKLQCETLDSYARRFMETYLPAAEQLRSQQKKRSGSQKAQAFGSLLDGMRNQEHQVLRI